MLKAILHGKAGRIEHNIAESVSWSSLFKTREDLLTSTVFERFAYLSEQTQKSLLMHWFQAVYGSFSDDFGIFESITYWPRYTHEHNKGTNQVEPDLILNFTECNIIIEVKSPNGGDQYLWQWKKEIESFIQSDENKSNRLYFLAIGRITEVNAKQWAHDLLQPNKYTELKGVAALNWGAVGKFIVELLYNETSLSNQDYRILDDILDGLSLYGLQKSPFKWTDFSNFPLPEIKLEDQIQALHSITTASSMAYKCSYTSLNQMISNHFSDLDLQQFKIHIGVNNDR